MSELLRSEIFLLAFTCGVYVLSGFLYRKAKVSLLHPLLVSASLIILFLVIFDIQYEQYSQGTRIIQFLLGPSVVALGYALYEQIEHIRVNLVSILTAITVGSIVGVVSVVLIARWLGAEPSIVASLQPKSVTTPIAISISARSGGIPGLTAVVVILVGIFGGLVGPWLLQKLRIESRVAKGLAIGAAAHGIGTAKAVEMGLIEGAVSGLAIGLMGIVTALLIPLLEQIL